MPDLLGQLVMADRTSVIGREHREQMPTERPGKLLLADDPITCLEADAAGQVDAQRWRMHFATGSQPGFSSV